MLMLICDVDVRERDGGVDDIPTPGEKDRAGTGGGGTGHHQPSPGPTESQLISDQRREQ